MDVEEVIEMFMSIEDLPGNERWQIIEFLLETSNDAQWHYLYRMLSKHDKNNCVRRRVEYVMTPTLL